MLAEFLLPVQKSGKHVITSTDDAVMIFRAQNAEHNRKNCHQELFLGTVDAVNMYPSICQHHITAVVGKRIDEFYGGNPHLTDFLLKVLDIIMRCQFIHCQNFFSDISSYTGHHDLPESALM